MIELDRYYAPPVSPHRSAWHYLHIGLHVLCGLLIVAVGVGGVLGYRVAPPTEPVRLAWSGTPQAYVTVTAGDSTTGYRTNSWTHVWTLPVARGSRVTLTVTDLTGRHPVWCELSRAGHLADHESGRTAVCRA